VIYPSYKGYRHISDGENYRKSVRFLNRVIADVVPVYETNPPPNTSAALEAFVTNGKYFTFMLSGSIDKTLILSILDNLSSSPEQPCVHNKPQFWRDMTESYKQWLQAKEKAHWHLEEWLQYSSDPNREMPQSTFEEAVDDYARFTLLFRINFFSFYSVFF